MNYVRGVKRASNTQVISIVDDDESIREATASLLRSVGFNVETFVSAEEFLESIHFHTTACLILDIRMAEMSGLELQKKLVAQQYLVPIIFMTAHGSKELEVEVTRRGAIKFLYKPFSAVELLRTIRAIMDVPGIDEWIE